MTRANRQEPAVGGSPTHPRRTQDGEERHATAWVDGGARGNPGEAGCGIVLELADRSREEHFLYLGRATNNVAEYAALLAALERAAALGLTHLELRTDSELVAHQMNGRYRVRAAHLAPLWTRAQVLARGFAELRIVAVRRHHNVRADALANHAIDARASSLPAPRGVPCPSLPNA